MIKFKLTTVLLLFTTFISAQNDYADSLEEKREAYSHKILETDKILNAEERSKLKELNYFPVDSTWRITGLLEKDKGKKFEMPTSTERKPLYRRYGWVHLEKGDRKFKLAVYQNLDLIKDKEYKNYLFLPFKDANAPEITYGAGRYIELYKNSKSDSLVVDFNTAFNPYCVYSYRYSCPITPEVNHLDFNINAGEFNPVWF